ncbi:L-gulono-1,4-lactone dehydrogenase [Enhygromyxa salina]|uniref:L-gulono-1,4-lactone dehydrogenase n=1 Tax=Enhygromyxa salina TaxID=215803 RepID=A0A2S9YH73_9BACT|nr:D-arabinono-1,4-lactone oxidase [Enhygromyxa salina]PRQ04366.1 L-gulono-1,4-lactone dehydrogenase [Enhygromyxa salina]
MAPTSSNWSRTQRCTPTRVEQPTTEDEIVALVTAARTTGTKVKVVGARHSWSDIAMSDGVIVSLDRMQEVVEIDEQRGCVRVQAGIRLDRLNEALAAKGLALPILGSVCEQSLAGVMSTGTHGSSLVHGNIPSFVIGLRLVTGTGELVVIDEEHPLLNAARVGLGALGIITEVTIRVGPAFQLCETTEVLDFASALANMQAIARSAEYVKLWWLPHTSEVIVFRCERTSEPGEVSRLLRWVDRVIVNMLLFGLVLWLGRHWPGLIPAANGLVARTYLKPRCTVGRSDQILSLAMPPRHRETEYALPLDRAAEALSRTRALIESSGVRVNFITEVRFVKADDGWMSPASERDSCQLGAYMAQAPGIDGYFAGFEEQMKQLGGRPHWGKEFRASAKELREMYPRADAWAQKVRELDPDGVFRNPFLDRVLPAPRRRP